VLVGEALVEAGRRPDSFDLEAVVRATRSLAGGEEG
jgi:hypothetical protein